MKFKINSKLFRFSLLVLPVVFLGCSDQGPNITASFNQSAAVAGNLPANPLQWNVITAALNANESTMSTLYGNDLAMQYARSHSAHDYPPGSALSFVTWVQGDDGRWFGARLPNQIKSVEFVFVKTGEDGTASYSYEKYEGSPLKLLTAQQSLKPNDRASELLSQRAAVMP